MSEGQVQWYALEADSMDEMLLAVARLQIQDNENKASSSRHAAVDKMYFTQHESTKEHITIYLMKNIIHQLKRISFHLNLSLLTVEVQQSNEKMIELLENESFQETGGYLGNDGMVFKFSIRMDGEDKGILHLLPPPSSSSEHDVPDFMKEDNEVDGEGNGLDDLLESLEGGNIEESSESTQLGQSDNMTSLIESLFEALHKSNISDVQES